MRKYILLLLFALIFSPLCAQIEGGQKQVALFGGASIPLSGYEVGGMSDISFGKTGLSYGAEFTYFISSKIGVGLEFSLSNFPEDTTKKPFINIATQSDLTNLLLNARYNITPQKPVVFYIPAAFGYGHIKAKTSLASGNLYSERPAFYIGLGAETKISERFFVGLETRYAGAFLDKDRLGIDSSYLDILMFMAKVGIRF